MFVLDNKTLLFAQIFVGLCLFVYSLYARGQFDKGALLRYRFANLSYSLGFTLLLFQGGGNAFVSVILANTLALVGFMLFTSTAMLLFGRKASAPPFVALLAVNTAVFLVFTYVMPKTFVRIVVISASIAVFMAYGIVATLADRGRARDRYARLFVGTSAFYVATLLFRIVYTLETNFRIQSIFSPDTATSVIFLATIAYHVSINSVIFLQVNALAGRQLNEKLRLLELSHQDIRNINSFFNERGQRTGTDRLYRGISEFLLRRFNIDACAFYLAGENGKYLDLAFKAGFPDEVVPLLKRLSMDFDSSAVRAYRSNAMVTIPIGEYPENALKARLEAANFKTLHSFPLNSVSGNVGIMTFGSKGGNPLLENESEILTLISNQIGTILENADQYQKLRLMADTDPLTGILNRREFSRRCARQLGRVRRYGRPACLLMLDLDRFKSVNDRFGHDAGDAVLQSAVEATKGMLRETDLFGRYGGEEFLVLLDETEKKDATVLAERIRANIEGLSVEVRDEALGFTVSIGLTALLPEDTIETAFARADEAMYKAKEAGRNRVVAL